ncbi:ABC transporter substrate-binding protein [Streptomyces sp. SBT349]|uniref:ABC transporter substrate-binding protein n=1 Tax=Streptomyces sp. SBT349 TaxID=1580539 RepID=UPI00066E37B8|nr:iron-siderophore ABC transporter substrate-binding protein [Streptomyces sp. SBT349]
MRRLLRAVAAASAAGALLAALAGCGSGSVGESSGEGEGGSGAGGITVSTARGDVTLDDPALKVVSLEWVYTEELLALGVTPVGNADNAGYAEWLTAEGARLPEDTTDVGLRNEPSIERIRVLEPDLIVGDEERLAAGYEQLEEIAPVLSFAYTTAPQLETMERNFTELARAVGEEEKAAEVLGRLDAAAGDLTTRLAEAGAEGATYALAQGFTLEGNASVRMLTEDAFSAQVLGLAGLTNGWHGEPDAWGMTTVGVEGLTTVDPEASFLYVASSEDDPFTGAFAGNPVWEGLSFVEEDRVFALDPGQWLFGGPLSAIQLLDEAGKALNV